MVALDPAAGVGREMKKKYISSCGGKSMKLTNKDADKFLKTKKPKATKKKSFKRG